MSVHGRIPSVAERARRVAENIGRIAEAAKTDQPAAQKLGIGETLQLKDTIGYDLIYVRDWVTRRLGVGTADALVAEVNAILSAMDKPQERSRGSGALVLDLFIKARQVAFNLRNWANDIERDEARRRDPPATPQYVTIDKAAALVNRDKKTLERWINARDSECPPPDIEGGGGRPHEWLWPNLRPWLEKKSGRSLPERFPSMPH